MPKTFRSNELLSLISVPPETEAVVGVALRAP